MITMLSIDCLYQQDFNIWGECDRQRGIYREHSIPEPYQFGDCPDEMFAEFHGVRSRLLQYGNQPRS